MGENQKQKLSPKTIDTYINIFATMIKYVSTDKVIDIDKVRVALTKSIDIDKVNNIMGIDKVN